MTCEQLGFRAEMNYDVCEVKHRSTVLMMVNSLSLQKFLKVHPWKSQFVADVVEKIVPELHDGVHHDYGGHCMRAYPKKLLWIQLVCCEEKSQM